MKYENYKQANDLIKKIKQDEAILSRLASYTETGNLSVMIIDGAHNICKVGVGDFDHDFSKTATVFINDCIQIVRDRITKQITELEKL